MPRSNNKKTLASVIVRVRQIAKDQYEDKIYDNILAIFNQLTTVEKRVLLRGLIGICFVVDEKILERGEETRDQYEVPVDNTASNTATPAKKKSKLATIGTYVGTGILVSILLSAMFGSFVITGENGILARIENFISVIKNAF